MAHAATGEAGELLVGGRSVAKLGKWVYDRDNTLQGVFATTDGWQVKALLLKTDEYWLDRTELKLQLRLWMGQRSWTFFNVDFARDKTKAIIRGSGKPVIG